MDLFGFEDYKKYLNQILDQPPIGGHGARARLSQALSCQTAYTAQVLRGQAQFTLEQAEKVNVFLKHSEEEAQYFLLLVQLARAGSAELVKRIRTQLKKYKEDRQNLGKRFKIKDILGGEEQARYFSEWYYAAVHALASTKGFENSDQIAQYLKLPRAKVQEVIRFLVETGILKKQRTGGWDVGSTRLHLKRESTLINRHHTNWRLKAVQSLEDYKTEDLHYSSIISVAEADRERIMSLVVELIEKSAKIINETEPTGASALCLDLFRL